MNTDIELKIIVVGPPGAGKTSFINTYCERPLGKFNATIGINFSQKNIEFNGRKVSLQFFDIGGQERYANMTRVYYQKAHGALVMYEKAKGDSFAKAKEWKADIDAKLGKDVPSLLIANKCDLAPDADPKIDSDAEALGFVGAFKTSATQGTNVTEAVSALVQEIFRKTPEPVVAEKRGVDVEAKAVQNTSCSC